MSLQQSVSVSSRWGWLVLACAAAGVQAADMPEASAAAALKALKSTPAGRHSYYTGGVHNTVGCLLPGSCVYPRKPGEPSDPLFPEWWVSDWTMYRIFNQAAIKEYPPPYASPPAGMSEGQDYETSYGASYYDSSYVPADGDGRGAMMEHYEKRCLPIFPGSNHYSCSFVSLGNKAYFLRYADRPKGTPQCCQFSLDNHPPRRDFIKHLPYNAAQSTHLNGSVQAYSRVVQRATSCLATPSTNSQRATAARARRTGTRSPSSSPAIPARRRTRPWSARTTATSARRNRTRNRPG
ncbi:hypothetical protein JOS77_12820 [Chromobacterium haemolyticum]|nr:hypothetical protein JOS77_12820 [Chromobacterium haemolyticum]